jgi:hypothetical protein
MGGKIKMRELCRGLIVFRVYLALRYRLTLQELVGGLHVVE